MCHEKLSMLKNKFINYNVNIILMLLNEPIIKIKLIINTSRKMKLCSCHKVIVSTNKIKHVHSNLLFNLN